MGIRGSDLEDLTQDVFLTAFRRRATFDASRPLRPWLGGIAVRLAIEFRRLARHGREVGEDLPDVEDGARPPDERISDRQDKQLLFEALEALETGRRAVFVMYELNEQPMAEIAQALEIPVNTAYSRLRLAREDFTQAVRRLELKRGSP